MEGRGELDYNAKVSDELMGEKVDNPEEVLKPLKEEYMESEMTGAQLDRLKHVMKRAKHDNRHKRRMRYIKNTLATAASFVVLFIAIPNVNPSVAEAMSGIPVLGRLINIVTFRDYHYNDGSHSADVHVPELAASSESPDGQSVENEIKDSAAEINTDIQRITDDFINDFTEHMQKKLGYKEIIVDSMVLVTADNYFTLKLTCYQAEASGYQRDYYYTLNLIDGKRMHLKDIFTENADYVTPISDEIKKQMQEQMAKDDGVKYWLNDEYEDINFNSISEDESFYINPNNNVVICFNQGDVAPMYMGCLEFEIPGEVLSNIRK